MKTLELSLERSAQSYPIVIGSSLFTQLINIAGLQSVQQICIITNDTVAALYLEPLKMAIRAQLPDATLLVQTIADGEQYKSFDSYQQIIEQLVTKQFRRNSVLIALGGGVIGDLTGYVAATYYRGVQFVQLPTTLLAMVDSSVGGKTALNLAQGKNLVGAFHHPQAVLSQLSCLATLPSREFSAGMAEIIKAAIIHDSEFFDWLESNQQQIKQQQESVLTQMIYRACQIKAEIVAKDELEKGSRAWLNLGHSFGHAIERELGYGQLLHGEAVAIGICLAAKLSVKQGLLESAQAERITELLQSYDLPVELPNQLSASAIASAMLLDKKNLDSNLRLILPTDIGAVKIDNSYSSDDIELLLENLPTATL